MRPEEHCRLTVLIGTLIPVSTPSQTRITGTGEGDPRVGDARVELRHPGHIGSSTRRKHVTNDNVATPSACVPVRIQERKRAHPIFDGSTLLRTRVSLNTAASRSSGTQSLNPPFLA